MLISLLISSAGHLLILCFMVFGGMTAVKVLEEFPPPNQYDTISKTEYDAILSSPPINIFTKIPINPEDRKLNEEASKLSIEVALPILIDDPKEINLEVDDRKYLSKTQIQEPEVSFAPNVNIKPNKNIEKPPTEIFMEADGNEKKALVAPSMAKPTLRTADRIDKVAVDKSKSQKIVEVPKKAVKASLEAEKVIKITKVEAPKAASSEITPEGQKDVEIVALGVVQKSSPPLSRPSPPKKVIEKSAKRPVKRPKASELLKKVNQENQYDALLSQVEKTSEDKISNVSIIERRNMVAAIAQKLAKYWEQGILSGNSNFEKYVVQVEVKVNSVGEIIGGIKPIVPAVPKGRYLIAFRQASNALISAGTLPIIPDKYPIGTILLITFDPESGFSF